MLKKLILFTSLNNRDKQSDSDFKNKMHARYFLRRGLPKVTWPGEYAIQYETVDRIFVMIFFYLKVYYDFLIVYHLY